ncbi:Protein translocase subunit SecA [Geodia barretti]|uniref:Protein translocase subunit SecA n=1 Tax=Geodia barretti TaxID=519541 RepID=A0AA35RM68_GEOBA|nr:Protein translocase subunit SecA [Geodia barretti]
MVGDTPERAAEKLRGQLVPQVNRLEDSIRSLTDEALGAKTDEFRRRVDDGASLDDLLRRPLRWCVRPRAARWVSGTTTCS